MTPGGAPRPRGERRRWDYVPVCLRCGESVQAMVDPIDIDRRGAAQSWPRCRTGSCRRGRGYRRSPATWALDQPVEPSMLALRLPICLIDSLERRGEGHGVGGRRGRRAAHPEKNHAVAGGPRAAPTTTAIARHSAGFGAEAACRLLFRRRPRRCAVLDAGGSSSTVLCAPLDAGSIARRRSEGWPPVRRVDGGLRGGPRPGSCAFSSGTIEGDS